MTETLFWICAAVVAYTYLGYGMLLWLAVKAKRAVKGTPKHRRNTDMPPVTLLVCAYNEASIIDEKMHDIKRLDYPDLHIVWATDGSDDGTPQLLRERYPEVEVLHTAERRGKTAAMNRAMRHVKTPIVVMTDANTMLCPEAIREIVRCFDDPKVGCVSGEKRVLSNDGDTLAARGEGAYWQYESTLKRWDGELYSAMGAAGELIALRTALYEDVPEDCLLDDFVLSMRLLIRGWRIAYCPTAYACERGSANMAEEQKRKQRIAAGGLQSVWMLRELMNPFRHGIAAWQFVGHRVLRWTIAPLCLLMLVPLNVMLVTDSAGSIYTMAWLAQLVFYTLAACGVKIPAYFTFMNINVLRGARYLWRRRGNKSGAWEKAERA